MFTQQVLPTDASKSKKKKKGLESDVFLKKKSLKT